MNKATSIVFAYLLFLVLFTGYHLSSEHPSQYYITLEEDGTRCVIITGAGSNKIQAMSCDWK